MNILCKLGFHKKRYWDQWNKKNQNGWTYKTMVAEGCKCDRCGKVLWRRDYDNRGIVRREKKISLKILED